jgi:hypothetical protein
VIPVAWAVTIIATAAAGLGGIKAGAWYVHTQWDREKLAQSLEREQYIARNYVRISTANDAIAAAGARSSIALGVARHANAVALEAPVSCPETGKLADIVIPGAGDRMRELRAAAASAAASAPDEFMRRAGAASRRHDGTPSH